MASEAFQPHDHPITALDVSQIVRRDVGKVSAAGYRGVQQAAHPARVEPAPADLPGGRRGIRATVMRDDTAVREQADTEGLGGGGRVKFHGA